MHYLIDTKLRECTVKECLHGAHQYVAVLSPEEWAKECDTFEMGIDMEQEITDIHSYKTEVNYDSVTGHLPFQKGIIYPVNIINLLLHLMKGEQSLLTRMIMH